MSGLMAGGDPTKVGQNRDITEYFGSSEKVIDDYLNSKRVTSNN